jgi:hypothetical protein
LDVELKIRLDIWLNQYPMHLYEKSSHPIADNKVGTKRETSVPGNNKLSDVKYFITNKTFTKVFTYSSLLFLGRICSRSVTKNIKIVYAVSFAYLQGIEPN